MSLTALEERVIERQARGQDRGSAPSDMEMQRGVPLDESANETSRVGFSPTLSGQNALSGVSSNGRSAQAGEKRRSVE